MLRAVVISSVCDLAIVLQLFVAANCMGPINLATKTRAICSQESRDNVQL
jgi:hypothetical protein